jgi:hypothetical protein
MMRSNFTQNIAALLLSIGFLFGTLPVATALDTKFNHVFSKGLPKLKTALERLDKHEDLSWIKKQWNQRQINNLINDTLEILEISGLNETREHIQKLERNIAKSHRKIVSLREKKITAPDQKKEKKYDKQIRDEERKIKYYRSKIDSERRKIAPKLREIGLDVEDEQLDVLLSSVVGDEMVSMAVVFNNVKDLTVQFQQLTHQSGENFSTAKRYYGMYTVLLRILLHMQDDFIEEVNKQYLPQIDQFIAEAQKNINGASQLLKISGSADREVLQSNIEANQLTEKVATFYKKYLIRLREEIRKSNRQLNHSLKVALNTYNTATLSGELIVMLRKGIENFDTLAKLQPPQLMPFENAEMQREFENLSMRLQKVS